MSRMAEAAAEQQEMSDLADHEMQKCLMDEMEQQYVESLRRVANGTATLEDAKMLAAGCGIDFNLI
jgi:hypothetical protein